MIGIIANLVTTSLTELSTLLTVRILKGDKMILTRCAALGGLVLPLASPPRYLSRLMSIVLGLTPAYTLFSIAYEPLFLAALAGALYAWMLVETRILGAASQQNKTLRWSDVRLGVAWLVFNNMAFFGTGEFLVSDYFCLFWGWSREAYKDSSVKFTCSICVIYNAVISIIRCGRPTGLEPSMHK